MQHLTLVLISGFPTKDQNGFMSGEPNFTINICSDFRGIYMSGLLSLPMVDVRVWSKSLLSAHNGCYFQSTIMFTLWSVAVWAGFCQPPLSPTSPQCCCKSRISEVKYFFVTDLRHRWNSQPYLTPVSRAPPCLLLLLFLCLKHRLHPYQYLVLHMWTVLYLE